MEPQQALEIGQMAIYTVLLTAAPLLLSSLCVGLTIAIFQAATQVHEMTLVFVPKIAAVLLGIIVFGSFMMRMVLEFTQNIFAMIAQGPGL
ncbi:MAG: flagellar biosynthesis protein FliQ [Myxococcota bacterium]|jgi:flagellar biosynthetic protein FliQ|nr:flagellar biosynthesis protein FliQ [Myxococcota bacterium]